ncbi:ATP/GTP-binding protein [Staphylococcus pseudintermedius]|uniref:AAA family ATPase n=1 Tax=Staphylococcus pseudintermedius TaxID=283734 RepID=UPI002032807A|nr:ATP-binding protein [Staphylococcus pseudintermedius]MDA3114173.1 ATP-binding protein [Staphylococcus pseudintermedius]MDF0312319.1 ATP-binding protein [Staphylococcus pseudintermedius]MDK3603330.1 ATP-binding protein [Staphylococcus pseudintermedius]MDK3610665.1 ATP-binding protein [Staphylococcus pseudintermedius]MDK3642344.1 ATP-binding protein [Staphylococcus pseudintermedius]
MLINFEFKNHLSYRDDTVFSMETGKRLRKLKENTYEVQKTRHTEKINLLKSAIVFGANGSGKSNLISALKLMQELILSENMSATKKIPKVSFLLDDYSVKNSTKLCVEIVANGIQYQYQFEYVETAILRETLFYYENGKYHKYFERDEEAFIVTPKWVKDEVTKTRRNELFLKVGQSVNDTHCLNVYRWFSNQLVFINGHLEHRDIKEMLHVIENEESKRDLIEFLQKCDIKVADIDTTIDTLNIPKQLLNILNAINNENEEVMNTSEAELKTDVYKLNLVYKKYYQEGDRIGSQRISFNHESEGTKKLITLALNILDETKRGSVFVMDEFDDSLHLNISKIMIKLFNLMENRSQFILTSHQLFLLDCDLRVDQIYLAKKDFEGASELYSIFDFNDDYGKRSDLTIFKRYLEGVYGAVPNVTINDFTTLIGKKHHVDGGEDE